MKNTNKVLITMILIMLFYSDSYCRMFFIDSKGNDSNDGTINYPWKTFDYTMGIITAGDTLNIREGTYNESIITTASGTDESRGAIVIRAYPGEKAVLRGNNYHGTGIEIKHSHIRFERIETEFWDVAMYAVKPASFITLTGLIVHDVNYGISIYNGTHDITLNNCEMFRFGHYGFDATATAGTGPEDDITNITLVNCYSHDPDFTTPNHNPDGNADGFAFGHGRERNVMLINCIADHTGDGFDLDGVNVTAINCTARNTTYIFGGGFKCWADTVILYNCLSYNNLITGGELARVNGSRSNTYMINCTFIDNGEINLRLEANLAHLKLYNSLVVGGIKYSSDITPRGLGFISGALSEQYEGDYNIFHSATDDSYISVDDIGNGYISSDSLSVWQKGTGQDLHSYFYKDIDTLFSDRQNHDYHLRKGVGAIDNGTPLHTYSTDHDGNKRDNKPDIGCYEYIGGSDVNNENVNPEFIFYCFSNSIKNNLKILFVIVKSEEVTISICDITGRVVLEPVKSESFNTGGHIKDIDCTNLGVGVYLAILRHGNETLSRKFIKE